MQKTPLRQQINNHRTKGTATFTVLVVSRLENHYYDGIKQEPAIFTALRLCCWFERNPFYYKYGAGYTGRFRRNTWPVEPHPPTLFIPSLYWNEGSAVTYPSLDLDKLVDHMAQFYCC